MIRKPSDRKFYQTIYYRYINDRKYSRRLYKDFEEILWLPISWRLRKKLKSVQHCIIHNQEKEANHFIKQLMEEAEIQREKQEKNIDIIYADPPLINNN